MKRTRSHAENLVVADAVLPDLKLVVHLLPVVRDAQRDVHAANVVPTHVYLVRGKHLHRAESVGGGRRSVARDEPANYRHGSCNGGCRVGRHEQYVPAAVSDE